MARRVRLHADFESDLVAQIEWLAAHRDVTWIDRLQSGIDEAIELLEVTPAAGRAIDRDGDTVMRKLILRQIPFVIWHSYEEGARRGDLWPLRLFHARQDHPLPKMARRRRHYSTLQLR